MRLRLALFIVAAALASIGAILHLTAPPASMNGLKNVKPTAVATALPLPRSSTTAAPPTGTTALTEAMRKQFETAPDYAAFIHDAMQRPLEGGRFYAFLAYNKCQEIVAIEPKHFLQHEQSPQRDKSIGLIKELMDRCQGVKDYFPDAGVFFRRLIIANARGIPDALLIERGAFKPTTINEAVTDLERALASGDRYLIAATLEVNASHYAELYMSGYKADRHEGMVHLAAAAAACEIANACDGHLWTQIMCATGQDCRYEDLREFLRDGLTADEGRAFDSIKLALLKHAGH
jgi:hypothetical protein